MLALADHDSDALLLIDVLAQPVDGDTDRRQIEERVRCWSFPVFVDIGPAQGTGQRCCGHSRRTREGHGLALPGAGAGRA